VRAADELPATASVLGPLANLWSLVRKACVCELSGSGIIAIRSAPSHSQVRSGPPHISAPRELWGLQNPIQC